MEKEFDEVRIKYEHFEDVFNHDNGADRAVLTPDVLITTPTSPIDLKRGYQNTLDSRNVPLRMDCAVRALHDAGAMHPDEYTQKRHRRGEPNTIFHPPFFEMLDNPSAPIDVVTARCHSCNVVLRGHKNVTSNFIKHMKRAHPEVAQVYENIKASKLRCMSMKADYIRHFMERGNDGTTTNPADALKATAGFIDQLSNGHGHAAESGDGGGQTPETTCNSTTPSNQSTERDKTPPSGTGLPTGVSLHFPDPGICFASAPSCQQSSRNGTTAVSSQAAQLPPPETQEEERLRVHLSSGALEAMGRLLDDKLQAFVTKAEFRAAQYNNSGSAIKAAPPTPAHALNNGSGTEASGEHNSGRAVDLEAQLIALRVQHTEMHSILRQLQHSKSKLQREVQALDARLRRHKLIMRHVPVAEQQSAQQAVEEIVHNQLQLPQIVVVYADKLLAGRNGPSSSTSTMSSMAPSATPIVGKQHLYVELRNERDTALVLRNSHKLQSTGVHIERFQSRAALQRRGKLLVLRKELQCRCPTLKVCVRDTALIVDTVEFYWDDADGLCVSKIADVADLDVPAYLQRLSGHDFKEFLYVLQRYDVQVRQ